MKRLTIEEFIKRAKEVHGDKYDYSKVEYIDSKTKVCIICPKHGEFWQTPNSHLNGRGCKLCQKPVHDTESFIESSIKVHGNKYNYSKVEYLGRFKEVCIICPKHGEFWQKPDKHLIGQGCPKCAKNRKLTTELFIEEASKVHNGKYDYSKVNYQGRNVLVEVVCPIHGSFMISTHGHLQGRGCQKCALEIQKNSQRITTEDFIKKAKEVHGNKYDYSKVKYVNSKEYITIICPEHGEFFQTGDSHINGPQGCPQCSDSKLERIVSNLLENNGFSYSYEKRFEWLRNDSNNYKLSLDFYIEDKKIAIECQGVQHFKPTRFKSSATFEEVNFNFEKNIYNDIKKFNLCRENGINLVYFFDEHYLEDSKKFPIYTSSNSFTSKEGLMGYISSI